MGTNLPDITSDMVESLRMKTGLESTTISNLLARGWRYVEKIGEISRWEHPMWSLSDRKI